MEERDAFNKAVEEANVLIKRDGWSIPLPALEAFIKIIPPLCRVVEFGGGFATLVLRNLKHNVLTYEHNKEWQKKLVSFGCNVLFRPLKQIDDQEYNKLFIVQNPLTLYRGIGEAAKVLPTFTRAHNVFYDIKNWDFDSVNYIISDGPHGNGRAILWPLLRNKLSFPTIALLDNINHYPFVKEMNKVFDFKEIEKDSEDKWVIVELLGEKNVPIHHDDSLHI